MCGETNMADDQSGDKMMSVLYLQLVLEPAQKNHLWQFKTDERVLIRNTVEIRDVWLQPDDPDRFCRETPACFGGRSSPQSASAPGGSARTSPPQTNTRRTAADISSDIFCSRIRPSPRGLSVRGERRGRPPCGRIDLSGGAQTPSGPRRRRTSAAEIFSFSGTVVIILWFC